MVRRSKNEILVSILEALSCAPLKKTQIMFRCSISWYMLCDAIGVLCEKDLIELQHGHLHKYEITSKGLEVLEFQKKINSDLS